MEKSLTVLEAIFQHRNGIGTRALAQELKLNVATVHNIARTFCDKGYLRQDPETKVFYPGLSLVLLGRHPTYLRTLRLSASDVVDDVARELNESVMLASIDHGRMLNLKYIPSKQALRVQESEDISAHSYATAVGKVLLASLTESELESYAHGIKLVQFTPRTFATLERLKGEMENVRAKGYAQTQDEFSEGVSAVAVPICDPWGSTIAAIGASAPTVRLQSPDQFDLTLRELRKAATAIEKQWKETHQPRPRKYTKRTLDPLPESL